MEKPATKLAYFSKIEEFFPFFPKQSKIENSCLKCVSKYICVLIHDQLELTIGLQIWIMYQTKGDLKPTLAWNWLWLYPPKNVLRCFRVNAHLLW